MIIYRLKWKKTRERETNRTSKKTHEKMVYLNVAADQSVLLLLLAALFVRVLFCLFKFFPLQN